MYSPLILLTWYYFFSIVDSFWLCLMWPQLLFEVSWGDFYFKYPFPSRWTCLAILCFLKANLKDSGQLLCSKYTSDTVLKTWGILSHSISIGTTRSYASYYPHLERKALSLRGQVDCCVNPGPPTPELTPKLFTADEWVWCSPSLNWLKVWKSQEVKESVSQFLLQ